MQTKLRQDPRYYQIGALSALLLAGILLLGFEFRATTVLAVVVAAQATQWFGNRVVDNRPYDPLSAVITALSLTLLLRTADMHWAVLAAVIAIGSKFILRVRGKHVFNPANFALVALMLVTDQVWVSAGQWGSAMLGAVAVGALGLMIINRARYAETPLAFLTTYAVLVTVRALYLGDPLGLVVHHLGNGALLIFTFFMISDPKTAPDNAPARLAYGALVATAAAVIEFKFFVPAAPVWALAFLAPLVPLLDFVRRAPRYQWQTTSAAHFARLKGH